MRNWPCGLLLSKNVRHGEAPLTEGRNLCKSGRSVGVKTKRSMRLKRQVGEHAHRSHRSTQVFSHAESEIRVQKMTMRPAP